MNRKSESFTFLRRSSLRLSSTLVLGGSLLFACQTDKFCADSECKMDGGEGGEKPDAGGGTPSTGGRMGSGGKSGTPGVGGAGGEKTGSGGESMGGDASAASGGKPEGSGGMVVDPGELDGSVAVELLDILPGGSAEVTVSLERTKGFEGTVLVSLDGEPDFTGTQVFGAPDDDQVTLTIEADAETEQGYYDATIVAESADGVLSVEIPLSLRVRGAPGTLDLTFGDRENPWVGEGTQAEVAVDDRGYVYLRNQETIFKFDPRGVLDESFEPEGLFEVLGPMIGMEDGVLIGTADQHSAKLFHVDGTGTQNAAWTGTHQLSPEWPVTFEETWSLNRRDGLVVVGGHYEYPASYVQLFQATGAPVPSFLDTLFGPESGPVRPVHARLDSQGRVLATRRDDGAIYRLLADASLDTTFADGGELLLSGTDPQILDFEVLSDDGLAILVDDVSSDSLVVWTPSESGGVTEYHELEYPVELIALPDDRLLVTGHAYRSPFGYTSLFSRSGERIPLVSPNPIGSADLRALLLEYNPDAPPGVTVYSPVYDPTARRLILSGGLNGNTYIWSMWL